MKTIFESYKQSPEYKCSLVFEQFEKDLIKMFSIDGDMHKSHLRLIDHDVSCTGYNGTCYMSVTVSDQQSELVYDLTLSINTQGLGEKDAQIKEFDLEIKVYEGEGKTVSKRIVVDGIPIESFGAKWLMDITSQALSEMEE